MTGVDHQRRVESQAFTTGNVGDLQPIRGSLEEVVPGRSDQLVLGITAGNLPADVHPIGADESHLSGTRCHRSSCHHATGAAGATHHAAGTTGHANHAGHNTGAGAVHHRTGSLHHGSGWSVILTLTRVLVSIHGAADAYDDDCA